jgi:hypothetical protein
MFPWMVPDSRICAFAETFINKTKSANKIAIFTLILIFASFKIYSQSIETTGGFLK